jgi:hypothetical protein
MKRPVGRPELYPIKKLVRMDKNMSDAIEHWRRQQAPPISTTDAIRQLIASGLEKLGRKGRK